MIDCSLFNESSRTTFENQRELATRESIRNMYNFSYNLMPNVPYVGFPDDEHNLMKGIFIDKKNCIYKRPDYGNGTWMKQFANDVENKFNIVTKARYQ